MRLTSVIIKGKRTYLLTSCVVHDITVIQTKFQYFLYDFSV